MFRAIQYLDRVLLMAFCLSLLSSALHGQQINSGIFVGITASQVDGDSFTGYNKLGLSGGFFVNRHINYGIYWQAEVKYVSRGVYKGLGENDPTLYKSSYHYVELPLSIHYLYDQKIQIEAGASPEVLIGTIFSDENGVIDPAFYPDNRRFGLSVFGGLYYWFNTTKGIGMRFTYSAIPFRDPQEWNHPRYRGYYHNVISLTGAFKFSRR